MAPTDDNLFNRNTLKRSATSRSYGSSTSSVLEPNLKKPRVSNARFDHMIETMNVVRTPPQSIVGGKAASSGKKTQSKRKGARRQTDRYSPPISTDLGHELSFIKIIPKERPDALNSSSSPSTLSKAESSAPKPRSICNPLPSWLTNTFMSLSKKHPLRLLLPSNLSRPDTPRKNSEETLDFPSPEERSPESEHVHDETFAFAAPDTGNDENSSHTVSNAHEDSFSLDVGYNHHFSSETRAPLLHARESSGHPPTPTYFAPSTPVCPTPPVPVFLAVPAFPASLLLDSGASSPIKPPPDCYSADVEYCSSPTINYTDFPADIICDNGLKPFSTSGPASTIGSATVVNPPDSSRTYMGTQVELGYVDSPEKDNSDVHSTAELIERHEIDSRSSIQQSLSELVEDPLLSNIYSTPGPRYCAPTAMHFDSPTEDPLSSEPASVGYEINYAELDFHWTPFDRKGLTISGVSARPLFAPETPQTIDLPHTPLNYSQRHQKISCVDPPSMNPQLLPVSTGSSSSPAPVSPSPFRFAPPSQSFSLSQDHASQKSKVSLDHCMNMESCHTVTPAPKRPFAVPGVYISPLANSQSPTSNGIGSEDDLPSGKVALKTLTDVAKLHKCQRRESKNTNSFGETQNLSIATVAEDEMYPESQRTSASDDSIESWSAVALQR